MATINGFDTAVWAVDGARIKSELMRVVSYTAVGGAEGIVTPGDLKVKPLTTPGSKVTIDTGAVSILNRSPNVKNQMYVANGRALSTLDVTPTTGAGGRSDLVVVRVEDPQYDPWPAPAPVDAPTHPYGVPFIIENVPANTTSAAQLNLNYSAYALARLDIPVSTSAITASHIKDMRNVANPRRQRSMQRLDLGGGVTLNSQFPTWQHFPSVDAYFTIPTWAARAIMRIDLTGIRVGTANLDGSLRGQIEDAVFTKTTYFNEQIVGDTRKAYLVSDEVAIPTNLKGTTPRFRLFGVRTGGVGVLLGDTGTQVIFDIEFVEAPV